MDQHERIDAALSHPGSHGAARCDEGGPRRTRRRGACCTSTAASPALCRTRDSEMLPVEATGFEVQDSSLAWGCRSDCQERRPMSVANPRRSEPLFDVTEVRSTALFLHRPVVATARRGCALVVRRPRRSLPPVASLPFERSREAPTDRAMEQRGYQEKLCCPVCAPPAEAAEQSGFRIPLAASCPGSETVGRTNRGRSPAVSPSSR